MLSVPSSTTIGAPTTSKSKSSSEYLALSDYNFYDQPARMSDFDFESFTIDDLLPPRESMTPPPPIDTTPQSGGLRGLLSRGRKTGSAEGTWLWPNGGSVSTKVNTDYSTRSSKAALPVFVKGKGFGRMGNLPYGKEDPYRGKLIDYTPTDLVLIPRQYCYAKQPTWLRREAAEAYVKMSQAAAKSGIQVLVYSGYRDANHQRRLKRGGGRVGNPGRSEHHLGTTVDVTDNERHVKSNSYGACASGKWMKRNARKYGFVNTVRGEPWHFRYMGK